MRIFCNKCKTDTNHKTLKRDNEDYVEELEEGAWFRSSTQYSMAKCAGCGTVTLREHYVGDDDPEGTDTFHPPREYRKKPKWMNRLLWQSMSGKHAIYDYLNEIYTAINNELWRLAAFGVRSLIEHMMIVKVGDHRSFVKNLAEFHAKGHISNSQRDILKSTIDVGHAVTHRAHKPDKGVVEEMTDVAESIIEALFIDKAEIIKTINKIRKSQSKGGAAPA
jgi:hypothetical protein